MMKRSTFPAVCQRIWQVIENLGVVRNLSLIVPGTKCPVSVEVADSH